MCQLAVPQDPDILKSHSLAAIAFFTTLLERFRDFGEKKEDLLNNVKF